MVDLNGQVISYTIFSFNLTPHRVHSGQYKKKRWKIGKKKERASYEVKEEEERGSKKKGHGTLVHLQNNNHNDINIGNRSQRTR